MFIANELSVSGRLLNNCSSVAVFPILFSYMYFVFIVRKEMLAALKEAVFLKACATHVL